TRADVMLLLCSRSPCSLLHPPSPPLLRLRLLNPSLPPHPLHTATSSHISSRLHIDLLPLPVHSFSPPSHLPRISFTPSGATHVIRMKVSHSLSPSLSLSLSPAYSSSYIHGFFVIRRVRRVERRKRERGKTASPP